MKIFLVVGAADSWHATGYGHALLEGNSQRVLVSFVEYVKNPAQSMALKSPQGPYAPQQGKANIKDLGQAFGPLISEHMEELFDDGDSSARIPRGA